MNPSFPRILGAAASVCGSFHINHGSSCEDAWFMAADDSHRTIVLCDGCSTASQGAAAARIASQTVGAILHQNFVSYLYKDPLAIRVEAASAVEAALTSWARQNQIDTRQLAATLVAAAMDRDGRFVCLHMGDGEILGLSSRSKQILRVSLPENRLGSTQTYLTMNCSMARHLRVYRQTSSDLQSLFLCTDGLELSSHARSEPWIKQLLSYGTQDQLEHYLSSRPFADDASAALLRVVPKKQFSFSAPLCYTEQKGTLPEQEGPTYALHLQSNPAGPGSDEHFHPFPHSKNQ